MSSDGFDLLFGGDDVDVNKNTDKEAGRCGVCGQPKEVWVATTGELGYWARIDCDCDIERRRIENERSERWQAYYKIERLKREGFLNPQLAAIRFDTDEHPDSPQSLQAREYAENFQSMWEAGTGMILDGTVGTGKTFYAACIANAVAEQGLSFSFMRFSDILQRMTDWSNPRDMIRDICKKQLVVLDDFGSERETPYAIEQLARLIDERYNSGRPLVVTTNIKYEDIVAIADNDVENIEKQRVFDRVLHMCPIRVKFDGGSKRFRAGG